MIDENTEITSSKGDALINPCARDKDITEMHKTLFDPDNGVVYKLRIIDERQQSVSKTLDRVDMNLDALILDVAGAKGEKRGEKGTKEKIKSGAKYVVGIIFAVGGLYLGYFRPTHEKLVKIEADVEVTKDTIVDVIRGQQYEPPALKMNNDTTNFKPE